MRVLTRLSVAAIATLAVLAVAGSALAAGASRVVFVQTNSTAGNQIVAYAREADGTLVQAGVYNTGGLGGQLIGSNSDHLASQGSLIYDKAEGLLYAVNAGSNTISVFAVFGNKLALRQVIGSGGSFPVSITANRGQVYVLNAASGGSLAGFAVESGRLVPIPGSLRALGLPTEEPQFTHTPGQVIFSPDGSKLIVTTKAAGESIDVFNVSATKGLSAKPVVNSEPGAVPFAGTFDRQGHFVVTEAGPSNLATFTLNENGTVSQLDAVGSGQVATCWVVAASGFFYTSNTGSASVSTFEPSHAGQLLTFLGNTSTAPGTIDAAATGGGRFVYVQTGIEGIVDEFATGPKGELTPIGSVTVPGGIGGEGIVAR
jgi:6-phosphogluconolactonase (cycloisomerase 2 family)